MSISAVNTNAAITAAQQAARNQAALWNPTSSTSATPPQDSFTSDFASILASVQAGDITSAQAALTKLQSDQVPADTSYSPTSTAASTTPVSGPQGDVQTLLQAVQGGDLTAAQKALTSLQSDMQANATAATSSTSAQPAAAHHHHHHHHHAAAAPAPTDPTADPSADPSSDSGIPLSF